MSNPTVISLFDNFRLALPGANDDVIQIELYNTCDELCREGLRIAPPQGTDVDNMDVWLPVTEWIPNYQLLLHGTLYRMYVQPGKPYSSGELAKLHFEQYALYLDRARSESSDAPATIYQRLLFSLRTQMPMCRDAVIQLEVYTIADKIRREALRLAPLTAANTNPETYFPDAATWANAYQATLHGALYSLYAQGNKPWSNAELAKANYGQYVAELDRVRSTNAVHPDTAYQRVIFNLRVLMPMVRDEAIDLEVFNIVNQIRREALRLPALSETAADTHPEGYLPDAATWTECYQAILNGVQFALYAQANKEWSKPDLATKFNALYLQELDRVRSEVADVPTSTYERLVFNVRTQMPLCRDATIQLELYNCIDKIRKEALRLPVLDADDIDPEDFLPDPETWAQCYQAILHCTLYSLYAQANKEWSKPDFAKLHYGLYERELERIRTEEASDPETAFNRIIDNARIHLPGAQDITLKLELFNALDEFCQTSLIWQEDINFNVKPNVQLYYLVPGEPGTIVRLMHMVGTDKFPVYGSMQTPGDLILRTAPNDITTYTATVAKTVTDPTDRDGFPEISKWILERYHNEILEGLLYRMMMQAAKPYSNEKLSIFHLRKFRGACANARTDMMRKNVYRTQAWRFPKYAVN
jgi:hypothetical protein